MDASSRTSSTTPKRYPCFVGRTKMRRWTRVTGGASGVRARKIQSATDCLSPANIFRRRSGDGDRGEEVRGGVEPALLRLARAVEAVAHHGVKDRLHVLRK